MTSPRLRPTGPAISPTAARWCRSLAPGPSPPSSSRRSLMPRPLRTRWPRAVVRAARVGGGSFHDQVEHPVLVERVGRRLARRRARRRSPGRGRPGPAPPGSRWTPRTTATPRSASAADQRVDLRAGADVDAAGRLVEQQHPAVAQQPAGQHDLLLVAAGQRADRAARRRPGARPAPAPARALRPALAPPVEEAAAGEPAQAGDADVAVDGLVEQQPLALALLRAPGRPRRPTAAPTSPAAAACRPPARCRRSPAGAVDGLEDLRPPRADQPGQPDDLAGARR